MNDQAPQHDTADAKPVPHRGGARAIRIGLLAIMVVGLAAWVRTPEQ